MSSVRLLGGISRGGTGRADVPLRFHLLIDRGLKSGKLDEIELDEGQIIRLIASGARALQLLLEDRA